ncbi:hypothetical protein JTB14_031689 [Gonioctena quinquepunctata]|nr:hypothetical protein JTB14_031689 [Gonioctena quinquepunctata]
MVIKVYISGISGNKEVKKRQQRVLLILDSKNVKYEVIDIAEPGAEEAKDFIQNNSTGLGSTIGDPNPRHPLPPQIFNGDVYCGDYDMFDMANEIDEMEKFLKLEADEIANEKTSTAEINLKNGDLSSEKHEETDTKENEAPNEQITDEKVEETAAPEDEPKVEEKPKVEEEPKIEEVEGDQNGAGDEQIENKEEVEEELKEEASTEKADE